MIYPTRFSPFPTIGIHLKTSSENADDDTIIDNRVNDLLNEYYSSKDEENPDNKAPPLPDKYDEKILQNQRNKLESLFNSAAASAADRNDDDGKTLSSKDSSSTKDFVEITKDWIKKEKVRQMLRKLEATDDDNNDNSDNNDNVNNSALEYTDTVQQWIVSNAKDAEELYADAWRVVAELWNEKNISTVPSSTNGGGGTFFVAPYYCPHEAHTFKRFAITINAALKRLCDGKIRLELFHPEYVGKKGSFDTLRRAPYPSLQFTYNDELSPDR